MFQRRVEVQARDGRPIELYLPETALPPAPSPSSAPMLRLSLPALDAADLVSVAASFFRQRRDASNLVVAHLDPDSWLQLEKASRSCRAAVIGSKYWSSGSLLGGHSLRFRPEGRKEAYVRYRGALWRVTKAFQVNLCDDIFVWCPPVSPVEAVHHCYVVSGETNRQISAVVSTSSFQSQSSSETRTKNDAAPRHERSQHQRQFAVEWTAQQSDAHSSKQSGISMYGERCRRCSRLLHRGCLGV